MARADSGLERPSSEIYRTPPVLNIPSEVTISREVSVLGDGESNSFSGCSVSRLNSGIIPAVILDMCSGSDME